MARRSMPENACKSLGTYWGSQATHEESPLTVSPSEIRHD